MRKAIVLGIHLALATWVGGAFARPTVAVDAPARIRVPSADVNKPAPLPILAKPSSDRASLDDPTAEAPNSSGPSGTVPARTKPAPFMKLSQPDPFENRKPVAPPVTLTEEVPNTTPRLPKP